MERIVFIENGFIILKISNGLVVLKTSDVVCRQERWILQNDAGVVDGVGPVASTYLTVISRARHTTRVRLAVQSVTPSTETVTAKLHAGVLCMPIATEGDAFVNRILGQNSAILR
jgi:hypothetical protein